MMIKPLPRKRTIRLLKRKLFGAWLVFVLGGGQEVRRKARRGEENNKNKKNSTIPIHSVSIISSPSTCRCVCAAWGLERGYRLSLILLRVCYVQ